MEEQILKELQAIRYDLSSLLYKYQQEIEYNNAPIEPAQTTEHFAAMRYIALNILKPYNLEIPPDAYSDIANMVTLYLMGSIGRYGFIKYLSDQSFAKSTQYTKGLDNLVLVEIVEEADKYLPGYKETSYAR